MSKNKMSAKKNRTITNRSSNDDIIELLLEDHKLLKRLIKVMKGGGRDLNAKQAAFREFAPALLAHAKPEEHSLYEHMKGTIEMRLKGHEGDVEHALADQLIGQIKLTINEGLWEARVKVLAGLVELHIREEEEDLFPKFKKITELEERTNLGAKYLQYRLKFESFEKYSLSGSSDLQLHH